MRFNPLTGQFEEEKDNSPIDPRPYAIQGPPGRDGSDGDKGEKGDQGERGYAGKDGKDGETGPVGRTGKTGPQGEKGAVGEKGDKGDKGDQGDPGEKGLTGADGTVFHFVPRLPAALLGKDNDLAVNVEGTLYKKLEGKWSIIANFASQATASAWVKRRLEQVANTTATPTTGGTGITTYDTGDTIYASAANTLAKRTIGTEGYVSKVVSGVPNWADVIEPAKEAQVVYEDFLHGNGSFSHFALASAGTTYGVNDSTAQVPSGAHPGIFKLSQNTATAVALYHLGDSVYRLGGGEAYFETLVYFDALSNATDDWSVRIGFGSNFSDNAEFTDGVYFYYNHANNSGNWTAKTASNSNRSTLNSSTPLVAATWTVLSARVNSAGTSVEFFVDRVSIGTLSNAANIPTTWQRLVTWEWQLFRSAGTGVTYMLGDYAYVKKNVTR